ncbi:hypothetical protein [Spiroplasma endosymbiont of Stenodema calcarata]|uniref:hypothetical protein n=1 Tax=Spiroplasma endosymbiont of Stenodema calcarata TaxID=3139328 RepID=UPI003CCB6296
MMRFKQKNWIWKINIFGKHIKAGSGKYDPFDYGRVKKIARATAKAERLTAKQNQNNY